ncbi:MAG TPA: hypothetical protein VFF11_07455, partial [Candidatus Binatia bacterium]|nr:hypothetical protein [Candidatus Binatia bacterium]
MTQLIHAAPADKLFIKQVAEWWDGPGALRQSVEKYQPPEERMVRLIEPFDCFSPIPFVLSVANKPRKLVQKHCLRLIGIVQPVWILPAQHSPKQPWTRPDTSEDRQGCPGLSGVALRQVCEGRKFCVVVQSADRQR